MNRIFAIILLFAIFFNWYGYRIVLNGLQHNSEVSVERNVDKKNYDEGDLLLLKIRLHLPYFTGSATYERAYGSIVIDGKAYEYVKRRIYNDTLELLCIPNETKSRLLVEGNIIALSSADGQAFPPVKKSSAVASFSFPDLFEPERADGIFFPATLKDVFTELHIVMTGSNFGKLPERPPQFTPPFLS